MAKKSPKNITKRKLVNGDEWFKQTTQANNVPFVPQGFPNLGVKSIPQVGAYDPTNSPYGTLTSGDASYAPTTFNMQTPFSSYESNFDSDPTQLGVQQGPVTKQRAQELGYKEQTINNRWRNPFENVKGSEGVQLGLYGVDAFLRKQDAIRNQQNYQNRLRNVFTQAPVYDYNALYGPDASGGTQYQSLIMAKNGANIRKGTSPAITDVEVEGGEFIQLPDLSTQHVQGPSHAKGGVHTNLPEGSRVFSDYLKPMNSKKTYAQLAKKYDTDQWEKILKNPFASDVDRNTATQMYKRNASILNELFNDQQIMNGNSDGTDQAAEVNGYQEQETEMEGREQEAQMTPEAVGKFGLDLKKGEKLSFTDPFEYGGTYYGGPAEFQNGGQSNMGNSEYMEEDYFIPNRNTSYQQAVQDDQEVSNMEQQYGSPVNSSWGLPISEESKFQSFFATLPPNLRTDDSTYNIRGYWDALGRPGSFDYSQPKEEDGYYHGFSRHPRTGMLLKSPAHPTFQMAVQGDRSKGYKFLNDPRGNVYSISPEDMPSEGYFANYQDGGYYQDGGMFPEDSTFYGATPGDTSVLTTGTDVMGSAKFQGGGYYSPEGKKYKLPEDAVIKKEDDKSIKTGDFVQRADGTIVKVSSVQAKMLAKASRSSAAKDFAEGRLFLRGWAQESPENANKLKIAENVIAKAIKAGQIEETKPKGWKEGDPTELIIKGNFKPSFKDRLLISEVVNKTGKGFGTDKYRIKIQQPTEGYSSNNKSGTLEKTGSFVGGMTPQDYEQRATYERALAEGASPEEAEKLTITSDPKQKAENRRKYLQELKYDVSDIPDSALISDDFYKNRYQDVTKAIENSFSEAGFRPSIGDDMLSGWEHYDAASYARNPSYVNIPVEEQPPGPPVVPPGNQYPPVPPFKQTPSTPGKFPLYQAAPEAMGYLAGLNPYTYYTPDYTHFEVAPPTLNIDPQLQSIDDSLQSAIRQTTGNASLDNSRNTALFNQALAAKQQAFANKQNYDADARFKADVYNADARTKENYLDVSSAANVYNEYQASAQDAAERERLNAIASLTKKQADYYQDEFKKMMYVSSLMPNFYYEGTDLRNPLKRNPYAEEFYSKFSERYKQPGTTTGKTPVSNQSVLPNLDQTPPVVTYHQPILAGTVPLNMNQAPAYPWNNVVNNRQFNNNFASSYPVANYPQMANDYMMVPEIMPQNTPYTVETPMGLPELGGLPVPPGYNFNQSNKKRKK